MPSSRPSPTCRCPKRCHPPWSTWHPVSAAPPEHAPTTAARTPSWRAGARHDSRAVARCGKRHSTGTRVVRPRADPVVADPDTAGAARTTGAHRGPGPGLPPASRWRSCPTRGPRRRPGPRPGPTHPQPGARVRAADTPALGPAPAAPPSHPTSSVAARPYPTSHSYFATDAVSAATSSRTPVPYRRPDPAAGVGRLQPVAGSRASSRNRDHSTRTPSDATSPSCSEQVHGKRLIWLDNGATTQKPRSVIDRLTYFYEHENSNVHRGAHTLAARATDAYRGCPGEGAAIPRTRSRHARSSSCGARPRASTSSPRAGAARTSAPATRSSSRTSSTTPTSCRGSSSSRRRARGSGSRPWTTAAR